MTHPLLPHFIYENCQNEKFEGSLKAYVLIVDIKGYTSYTQKIMSQGQTGAEKISNLLNEIFSPQVKIVSSAKGFIPYFAGDSYTIIFPDEKKQSNLTIIKLCQELRESVLCNPNVPIDEIGIKISVGYGQVNWKIDAENQYYYYFEGDVFDRVATLNGELDSNEVGFTNDLKLPPIKRTSCRVKDFGLDAQPEFKVNSDNIVESFIPQLPELAFQKSEFREVVSVFIKFNFENNEIIEEAVADCVDLCRRYDLYIKEIETGDKGFVLFGFQGAPKTYINLKRRAIEWALSTAQILEQYKEKMQYCIAMNLGRVFCGFIGGDERFQFGIVGHSVNCASRYLSYSKGNDVIVDKSMFVAGIETDFIASPLLKGVEKPVNLFSVRDLHRIKSSQVPLLGRDIELGQLHRYIDEYASGKLDRNILVFGDAGVGKSRLIKQLKSYILEKDLLYVSLYCNEIDYSAFLPFINYLKSILDYRPGIRFAALSKRIVALIRDLNPMEQKRISEVFAVLLGVKIERGFFDSLDAQSQFDIIKKSFISFFKAFKAEKKLVIKVDDIQWVDYATSSLLRELNELLEPLLIFSSRPFENKKLDSLEYLLEGLVYHKLQLLPLSREGVRAIVEFHLKSKVSVDSIDYLVESSNGNPFFLEQIIEYLKEIKAWVEKDNVWQLKNQNIDLKSGMQSILLSRIDGLDPNLQKAIKDASVLGMEFDEDIFARMLVDDSGDYYIDDDKFYGLVTEGLRLNIWRRLENNRYIFTHALLREAVYEMQNSEDLKHKHLLAAESIESENSTNLSPKYFSLLYHFEQAEDKVKLKKYLHLAASFARVNFRSYDALKFYKRYLKQELSIRERLKAYFEMYEIYEMLGEWDEAKVLIDKCLVLSNKLDPIFYGISKRFQGKYLTLAGKYDEATEALNEAYSIFEKNEDLKGTIECLESLGRLFFRQSRYVEAVRFFENAVELSAQGDAERPNFSSIGLLGLTFMNLGELKKGIGILEKYLKYEDINKLEECTLSIYLGIIKQEFGDFNGAEYNFHNGIHIAQLLGNKLFLSIAYGSMGAIHMLKDNKLIATEYLKKDQSITKELGDKQGESIVLGLFGEYELMYGDLDKAITYFKKQMKIATDLGYTKGLLKAQYGVMETYFRKGDYDQLMEVFNGIPESHFMANNMGFDLYLPPLKLAIIRKNQAKSASYLSSLKSFNVKLRTNYTRFIVEWFESLSQSSENFEMRFYEYIINHSEYNTEVYRNIHMRLMSSLFSMEQR